MMKNSNKHKESKDERNERLELTGTTRTRVVPDKTKYTRKKKHKERDDCNN